MSVSNVRASQGTLVSNKPSFFQRWGNLDRKIVELIRRRPNLFINGMGLLNIISFVATVALHKQLHEKFFSTIEGQTLLRSALINSPIVFGSILVIKVYQILSGVISHKGTAEPKAETKVYLQSFKNDAICAAIGAIGLILVEGTNYFGLSDLGIVLNVFAQHSAYVKTHMLNSVVQYSHQNGLATQPSASTQVATPATKGEKLKTESAKPMFMVKPENFKSYVTQFESKVKLKRTDLPIAAIWETLKIGYSKFLPAQKIALKAEYDKGERLFKEYQAAIAKPAQRTPAPVSAAKPKPANVSRTPNVPIKR